MKFSGSKHTSQASVGRPVLSASTRLVRAFGALAGAACLTAFAATPATTMAAESYPDKPVRIVVNFPPGGIADQVARMVGNELQASFDQPFIVENRAGANGNIGAAAVVGADPDGYTLLLSPSGVIAVNGHLYNDMTFDPMTDLTPVASQLVINSYLLVHPDLPIENMDEFLAYLDENGESVNYATPGSGSSSHLATELLKDMTDTQAAHIPFKGAAPAVNALLGGHVDFMFDPGTGLEQVDAGNLRLIAVASPERSERYPDVPTITEALGEPFDAGTLFGVLAPKGTPPDVIDALDREIAKAMESPQVLERVAALGADPMYLGPDDYARQLRQIHEQLGKLIEENQLQAE